MECVVRGIKNGKKKDNYDWDKCLKRKWGQRVFWGFFTDPRLIPRKREGGGYLAFPFCFSIVLCGEGCERKFMGNRYYFGFLYFSSGKDIKKNLRVVGGNR